MSLQRNAGGSFKKWNSMNIFRTIFYIGMLFFSQLSFSQGLENEKQIESRVDSLLSLMTLEEKIGQLQQVQAEYGKISESRREEIKTGKVGSVINESDAKTIKELQRLAVEESRLQIPLLIGRDVIHGFKTIFPIPLGQAATFNPELVKQGAFHAAKEAHSIGVNWTFAPMIDISRDARWGRIAESFGEDTYLMTVLGEAMVKGFQGETLSPDSYLAACAKHFAGYGAAEGGRDYNTVFLHDTDLRNTHFPPFKRLADIGVATFMSGFHDLNGIPVSGNQYIIRNVLKNEWKYNGMVVSDWVSIEQLKDHGFTVNDKESAEKALKAGVDMEMVSQTYKNHLKDLIKEQKIEIDLVNDAVKRILRIKFKLGLFENPYSKFDKPVFAQKETLTSAKKMAEESLVLLENKKNTLPLDAKKIKQLAVFGPLADDGYEQMGTWVFDGDEGLSITPLETLQKELGTKKVKYKKSLETTRTFKDDFSEELQVAEKSDAVLVFVGEESILSGEAHSRSVLDLPGSQEQLIHELTKLNVPVVVVVLAGRPLSLGKVAQEVESLLFAWHPGTMAGPAIYDVLFGKTAPSGKLPVTVPVNSGQIPIYYNHKNSGKPATEESYTNIQDIKVRAPQTSVGNTNHYLDIGFKPLYPFGYGLSYSEFSISKPQLEKTQFSKNEKVKVAVTVKNVGNVDAKEVVQLYIRDLHGSITRPVKELKKFEKIFLKKEESKTLHFELNPEDLSFYNYENEWVIEPGKFELWIGNSSITENKIDFEITD